MDLPASIFPSDIVAEELATARGSRRSSRMPGRGRSGGLGESGGPQYCASGVISGGNFGSSPGSAKPRIREFSRRANAGRCWCRDGKGGRLRFHDTSSSGSRVAWGVAGAKDARGPQEVTDDQLIGRRLVCQLAGASLELPQGIQTISKPPVCPSVASIDLANSSSGHNMSS
jgi:hypothetical protein